MGNDKLQFGLSAKQQIGERIKLHMNVKGMTFASAAESLGISRQRLHSYTRKDGKSWPSGEVFDKIRSVWDLDLLGVESTRSTDGVRAHSVQQAEQTQFSFEEPLTLSNENVKVVIVREGRKLVARVELRAAVKIA